MYWYNNTDVCRTHVSAIRQITERAFSVFPACKLNRVAQKDRFVHGVCFLFAAIHISIIV